MHLQDLRVGVTIRGTAGLFKDKRPRRPRVACKAKSFSSGDKDSSRSNLTFTSCILFYLM